MDLPVLTLPLQNPVLIFSLILLIILIAPLLLERIRIPSVIGLIVSGILIGPHGFNLLEQTQFVDVFSTIGLLYIMFIAGLELNLLEFKANRNKSLLFGLFTFMIPMLIGYPICHYLLGFDVFASLLIASIFATHTLVTYPIVSKLGINKDISVAITVGGTILTDTAVLIVLAVILGAHDGGLTQAFWVQLGISLVLFSFVVFLIIPRIAEWFFQKLESETYSHYIFVLSIMFFAAFLAEVAGLEAIIGAFAAGLALNKLIPSSSALMNRIEFIGNALFIPFFLISVGMIVDVGVLLDGPNALKIAGVMTVVAVAAKYVAAWLTQLVFKFDGHQRNLIFGLSSAHAAATLAVILVGYKAGIVDDTVLNAIVVIILFSCVISSFVTEHAAKNMAVEKDEKDDVSLIDELNMEQILIPVSKASKVDRLLKFAILIKEKESTHPLTLLNVVPNTSEAELRVATVKKQMETFLSESAAADVELKVKATIDQSTANGIARTVREIAADLILMGWSQKEGFLNSLVGDRMESILHQTIKTLFVCHLPQNVVKHKRLFLIVPPRAEFEAGFQIWVRKMYKLAAELTAPVKLYCNPQTFAAIETFGLDNKLSADIEFNEFNDWRDALILFHHLSESDLIFMVSARKGYISYDASTEKLPEKVQKYFPEYNRIVVYPQ